MHRTLIALFLVAASLPAQKRASPEVELKAKLNSPFLAKADWVLDYDKARAMAKKRKTLIFAYFTTSGY